MRIFRFAAYVRPEMRDEDIALAIEEMETVAIIMPEVPISLPKGGDLVTHLSPEQLRSDAAQTLVEIAAVVYDLSPEDVYGPTQTENNPISEMSAAQFIEDAPPCDALDNAVVAYIAQRLKDADANGVIRNSLLKMFIESEGD